MHKEIQVLHLIAEYDGPCEIGTLFLSPQYRQSGVGRFLSRSRFLFMADFRKVFAKMVIAEMRGISGASGQSPFWDGLGRHFFDIDFPKADYLSILNKKFIAELMPKHPIYISLLPEPAREVIGRVHKKTVPALKILEAEGFTFGRVDIFDAGPIVRCPLAELKTIRESVQAKVLENRTGKDAPGSVPDRWDLRGASRMGDPFLPRSAAYG